MKRDSRALKENGTSISSEERQKKEEDKSWDEMQGYEKNEEAPKGRRRENRERPSPQRGLFLAIYQTGSGSAADGLLFIRKHCVNDC